MKRILEKLGKTQFRYGLARWVKSRELWAALISTRDKYNLLSLGSSLREGLESREGGGVGTSFGVV